MKKGDAPVMIIYPPDELSEESIYAMSEFLHEICRSFEQHYHIQISRHINKLENDVLNRAYTTYNHVFQEGEEPF
jgi:hypothetical protein